MVYYYERPCKWKYRKCIDYNIRCDDCWHNTIRRKIEEKHNRSEQKNGISYYCRDPMGDHYL